MFKRFRKYWAELERGRPGSRFEEQYEKAHGARKSPIGRVVRITVGLLLFPVGVFFLAVPGPGLVVIAIGAVLIAREFKSAARFLDALELRARPVAKWMQQRWRRLVRARRTAAR